MIGVAPLSYDPAAPTTAEHPARRRAPRPYVRPRGRTAAPAPPRVPLPRQRQHRRRDRLDEPGPYLLGGPSWNGPEGARELHLGLTATVFVLALAVQAGFVREVRLRGAMLGERMPGRSAGEDSRGRSGCRPACWNGPARATCSPRITTDIDRLANAMREAVP